MDRRRERRLWLTAMFLGIAIVTSIMLVKAAHREPYGFISEFGGKEMSRELSVWSSPAPEKKLYYAFEAQLADVLPVMKKELVGAGWKMAYQDDEYVAFTRAGASGEQLVELEVYRELQNGSLVSGSMNSYVVLSPPSKTWLGQRIEWLASFFHDNRKKPPPLIAAEMGSQLVFEAKETTTKGKPEAELVWRNRSPDTKSGVVNSCFLRGYESDHSMPMATTLAPWETKIVKVTFPRQAAGDNNDKSIQQLHAIDCEYDPPSGSRRFRGRIRSSISYISDPQSSIGTRPYGHVVMATNPNSRAIQIRDLKFIDNDDVLKYKSAGPIQIAPGASVTLQTKRVILGPNYSLAGQFRLLPNHRWTEFHSFRR